MRANEDILIEIKRLFMEYEKEFTALGESGVLKERTVVTYLTPSWNFVRCAGGHSSRVHEIKYRL